MSTQSAVDAMNGSSLGVPNPSDGPTNDAVVNWQTLAQVTLAILGVGVVLSLAQDVLFPILLAFVIAFPLLPITRALTHLHLPRFVAAALIVFVLLAVVLLAVVRLVTPAQQWLRDAPRQMRQIEAKVRTIPSVFTELRQATETVEQMADTPDAARLRVEVASEPLSSRFMWFTQKVLMGAVVTICLLLLLLAFGDDLVNAMINLHHSDEERKHWHLVISRVEQMISSYLLTYALINAGLGTVIGLGLWAVGLPNPLLWGVMAAMLNFVPYAGLVVGTTVVTLVGLLTFDTPGQAALAPAVYLAANGVEANLVTPILLGRTMSLSPIVIFLSVVLWGWLWGVGGALIAVPLLVMMKVFCDHFPAMKKLGLILGSRSTAREQTSLLPWLHPMPWSHRRVHE